MLNKFFQDFFRDYPAADDAGLYGRTNYKTTRDADARDDTRYRYVPPANMETYPGSPYESRRPYTSNYDIVDGPASALGPKPLNGSERCIPKCFAEKGNRVIN